MNTLWPYASDEDLLEQIRLVLRQIEQAADTVDIYRNVIDPFSAIFDMARLDIDFDEWREMEESRQTQKSMQNAVGYFHQNILGCVDGWEDTGSGGGVDLRRDKNKIVAEIKNKHNTMNSSSAAETYRKMVRFLEGRDSGYTGYVVTIISKNRQRFKKPFHPSVPGNPLPERKDLYIVDGATFYELVTGDRDALKKLYQCMPNAIALALGIKDINVTSQNNVTKLMTLFEKAF